MQVGINLKKVQKQGRDESTRRLSCWRKFVVKKDCMEDYFCCKNDEDSKLVEFTNTERVAATVVRKKSAIYKRIDISP